MARRRRRGTRYLDEQETRRRVGLDNAARAPSDETHNRRKPRLASVARPELTVNAVDSDVLSSGGSNPERAVDSPHIKDNAILRRMVPANTISGTELAGGSVGTGHISGTLGKGALPNDINYGKVRAADLDYGSGRPVPAGKVASGYNYGDLKNKPALGKFLTKNDVKKSALR